MMPVLVPEPLLHDFTSKNIRYSRSVPHNNSVIYWFHYIPFSGAPIPFWVSVTQAPDQLIFYLDVGRAGEAVRRAGSLVAHFIKNYLKTTPEHRLRDVTNASYFQLDTSIFPAK